MRRFALLGCAAGFVSSFANTARAEEKISLVGAWQRCEPVNGCSKFAFFPNGRVIEQYRVGGRTVIWSLSYQGDRAEDWLAPVRAGRDLRCRRRCECGCGNKVHFFEPGRY